MFLPTLALPRSGYGYDLSLAAPHVTIILVFMHIFKYFYDIIVVPVLVFRIIAIGVSGHDQIRSALVFAQGDDILAGLRRIAGLAAQDDKELRISLPFSNFRMSLTTR